MRRTKSRALTVLILSVLSACVLLSGTAHALQPELSMVARPTKFIELTSGKSVVVHTDGPVGRVTMASPDTVDMKILGPKAIYLTGKSPGTTNMIVWSQSDAIMDVYDVYVARDSLGLKETMHKVIPDETGIQVISSGESVTLSGQVSSARNMTTALSLAEAYAPGKVVNLMQVGGVNQVMLEVRVAEMSKSLLRRLGINIAMIADGQILDGNVFFTFLNNLTGFDEQGRFRLADQLDSAFTFRTGTINWSGFVDAMKENGLVKILAEPNLICVSGQRADFLAGGEFPIPVPQGLGTVAIEYKKFGVGLSFSPTVLDSGRINLGVSPEVSELDFTNALQLSGAVIPAIATRRTSTTIELGDGQTFAIAGLVQDNVREFVNKIPLLGEIPVLGALFRSSEFRKNMSELVIIVTPHLVKPVDVAAMPMPTDGFVEPDNFEFYLLGKTEGSAVAQAPGTAPAPAAPPAAGFDGEIGHTVPPAN